MEWGDSPDAFRLYFGIDITKAEELSHKEAGVRMAGFLGHSGWSPGQLENELKVDSWVVSSLSHDIFKGVDDEAECWKFAISGVSDEMKLLANAPDRPWLN